MNGPDEIGKATNIKWHEASITRQDKERLLNQKGVLLWFTGLFAVGKPTLAHALENELFQCDCLTTVLDGDNVRHGLNNDLGFSPEDRMEHIRRIGEVAKLFAESGVITMTAFISPYRSDRDRVRGNMKAGDFVEGTNFMGWALTIARFKVLESLRRRKDAEKTLSESRRSRCTGRSRS